MATYPSLKYGTPPFVNPLEDDDPDNPFSLAKIAARKTPTGFNVPIPQAPFPGPRPTAESMAEAGPFAGSDPLPTLPPASAVPKLPRSLKVDDYISAPDPFIEDWNSAAARRDAHQAGKPIVNDKEYDIPAWQKALMVGANAAAGYVNAGRRTHVDPIDQKTLLRRPKYETAMDQWNTKNKELDSELNTMTTRYNMRRQATSDEMVQRQFRRQQELTDAQIERYEADAERLKAIAARGPVVKPTPEPTDQNLGWAMWNAKEKKIYPNSIKPAAPGKGDTNRTAQEAYLNPESPEEFAKAERYIQLTHQTPVGKPSELTAYQQLIQQQKKDAEYDAAIKRERGSFDKDGTRIPGLHEERENAGKKITAAAEARRKNPKAPGVDTEAVAKLKQLDAEWKDILGLKLEQNKISRDAYNSMIQAIDNPGAQKKAEAAKTETKPGVKTSTSQDAGAEIPKPPPPTPPPPTPAPAPAPAAAPQVPTAPVRGGQPLTSRGQGPAVIPAKEKMIQIRDRKSGEIFAVPESNLPIALRTADRV
jgi:hypothetical protein